MPQRETVNALRFHFRNWVMKGIVPPPSVYPKLDPDGDDHRGKKEKHSEPLLVPVTRKDIGFPALPQVLASANPNAPDGEDFIMAFVQYDWGDDLNYTENAGFHDFEPPLIRRVIKQVVPRTDADGNELGGVPVVLMRAPLGTYLGWNVTSGGFHKGQVCNYQGGWIPFARTKAERLAKGDPRLSLEERYGTHQGYVNVVSAAVADIEAQGYLLKADGDALIAAAQASNVLNP
jgi:hypothetical protein